MKVAITGSTGFIGSGLLKYLQSKGHEVFRLVRSKTNKADDIYYNVDQGTIESDKLEGMDAIVHLAGESVAEGHWNNAKKQRIRDSRVNLTKFLADEVLKLSNPPKVFICGSAIGFYGDRGNEELTESSSNGDDFLADVCVEWENAAKHLEDAGIRTAYLRTGLVISSHGGALAKMLFPFKMGAGGIIGNGKQYVSWITFDDHIRCMEFILENDSISGPVNAVAPNPVTNYDFTKALGKQLKRPTIFPMPGFAARLVFGEMADALLLSSARVLPKNLEEHGFNFNAKDIAEGMKAALSPPDYLN